MSRVLRFRAWDEAGESFEIGQMSHNVRHDCDADSIMQFTGLTDKNGVDIYESDLLQNPAGRIGVVVWHEYSALWDTDYVSDTKKGSTAYEMSYGFEPRLWGRGVEVIVNIFESPELL